MPERKRFGVDRSWSAQRVADEARAFTKALLRNHPDALALHEIFLQCRASDNGIWPLLTEEEKSELDDFPVVVVPTGEFDVWIAVAPSGEGKFIVLDQCIPLELIEFLAAVPSQPYPVWASCILQGALRQTTGPRLDPASWVKAPLTEFNDRLRRGDTEAPYSSSMLFGLPICMSFLLAHEYGHHVMKHFEEAPLIAGGDASGTMARHGKRSHEMEFAADAWAIRVISRLPPFELSSWLLSIELMFWYLRLIEIFHTTRRTFDGFGPAPSEHPPIIERAEKISRVGEAVFESQLDANGNLPDLLYNNLQDRQRIWGWVKKLMTYSEYLAECYCYDPGGTLALHERVRAGEVSVDDYEAEMKAIAHKHGVDSRLGVAKRLLRHMKSKVF